MYIGEFGAWVPGATIDDDIVPTPQILPFTQRERDRYQWMFDMRTYIEDDLNAGWACYSQVGQMPAYRKSNGQSSELYYLGPNGDGIGANYNQHGNDRGRIRPNTQKALFGKIRPVDGSL